MGFSPFLLVEQHLGGGDALSPNMGWPYMDSCAQGRRPLGFVIANVRVVGTCFITGLVHPFAYNVLSQPGLSLIAHRYARYKRAIVVFSLWIFFCFRLCRRGSLRIERSWGVLGRTGPGLCGQRASKLAVFY